VAIAIACDQRKNRPLQQSSPYLDLHLYDDNIRAIITAREDFNRGNVMSHAHGSRSQHKMTERKLTIVGTVSRYCGLVNSRENVQKTREQYKFFSSIAEYIN